MRELTPPGARETAMFRMLKDLRLSGDPSAVAKTALLYPELSEDVVEADQALATFDKLAEVGFASWSDAIDPVARVTLSLGVHISC